MKLKPYELVHVIVRGQRTESGKYMYVGELMSFPTPEGTIMVRRVPGHSGTLEEVRVADLLELSGRRPGYVSYAVVRGVGQFPTDMLRYEGCAPVNFRLVPDRWGEPFAQPELLPGYEGQPLMVAKTSTSLRNVRWERGRWSNFLWQLTEHLTEAIIQK